MNNLSYYDQSEWNAWKSGQPLETLLAALNKNYPGNVFVLAHSHGNVVVSEALRLATNKIVNTYVASQAAMSARSYDNTIPTNAAAYYTITTSDPQGNYYTNGAPSYFSASAGAGTYVNFFNPNDWALMGDNPLGLHPGWLFDQGEKPDKREFYGYTNPTPTIPSGYYVDSQLATTGRLVPFVSLNFPTNTYQIFAMCAQSYSLALGVQMNVGGDSFDPDLQVDLSSPPYNFGRAHIQHDTQFVYHNMTNSPYWLKLLQIYRIKN